MKAVFSLLAIVFNAKKIEEIHRNVHVKKDFIQMIIIIFASVIVFDIYDRVSYFLQYMLK